MEVEATSETLCILDTPHTTGNVQITEVK